MEMPCTPKVTHGGKALTVFRRILATLAGPPPRREILSFLLLLIKAVVEFNWFKSRE
jgi:hypothetical protein